MSPLPKCDPLLFSWARELITPDSTIWDIGANLGLFTFPAAFSAGSDGAVVAIEADEELARLLRRSARNTPPGYAPVTVLTAAVAGRSGITALDVARRGRAANHLRDTEGSSQAGGVRYSQDIISITLDWLLEHTPAPDLVKIDVEGSEKACLAGATRMLEETRPLLLCEVMEQNRAAVGELLHNHDYVLFDAAKPEPERLPLDLPAWNTLARPR